MDNWYKRSAVERDEEWREWLHKIPYIRCLDGWEFQPIPPFAGAMARFQVRKGKNKISVYLDVEQNLGCWDGPYWEIYPGPDLDDAWRCDMDQTFALQNAIAQTFLAMESSVQPEQEPIRDASCLDAGCDIDGKEPHKPHCDHAAPAQTRQGNDD